MTVPTLVYLHGFISSPASDKVRQLRRFLAARAPTIPLTVPTLPPEPAAAMATIRETLASQTDVRLIGSSMGGFYAAWWAHERGVPAVLINPAAYPSRLLPAYRGEHRHPYTDQVFTITERDGECLAELEPGASARQLTLLLQTGDVTLDYRDALQRWPDSVCVVEWGGDHRFQHFDRWIPFVLRCLGYTLPDDRQDDALS